MSKHLEISAEPRSLELERLESRHALAADLMSMPAGDASSPDNGAADIATLESGHSETAMPLEAPDSFGPLSIDPALLAVF